MPLQTPLPSLTSGFLAEILIVLAIILVLYIVFKLGKLILKLIFGLIANAIMGFITIFVANYFFAIGIQYALPVLVATAIFGLPAVGTLVILRLMGMLIVA